MRTKFDLNKAVRSFSTSKKQSTFPYFLFHLKNPLSLRICKKLPRDYLKKKKKKLIAWAIQHVLLLRNKRKSPEVQPRYHSKPELLGAEFGDLFTILCLKLKKAFRPTEAPCTCADLLCFRTSVTLQC